MSFYTRPSQIQSLGSMRARERHSNWGSSQVTWKTTNSSLALQFFHAAVGRNLSTYFLVSFGDLLNNQGKRKKGRLLIICTEFARLRSPIVDPRSIGKGLRHHKDLFRSLWLRCPSAQLYYRLAVLEIFRW